MCRAHGPFASLVDDRERDRSSWEIWPPSAQQTPPQISDSAGTCLLPPPDVVSQRLESSLAIHPDPWVVVCRVASLSLPCPFFPRRFPPFVANLSFAHSSSALLSVHCPSSRCRFFTSFGITSIAKPQKTHAKKHLLWQLPDLLSIFTPCSDMSRLDAHHDVDHPSYDGRRSGDAYGHSSRDFGHSGLRNELGGRDGLPDRDILPPNYYISSSSFSGDRRSLTSSSGFSTFVAPRMFNSTQGGGAAGDSWATKPATFPATPTSGKFPADGGIMPSQVQPSLSSFAHNHHSPSPTRGPSVAELYNSSLLPSAIFNDRDGRDPRDIFLGHRHIPQQPQPSSSPTIQIPHAQPPSVPSPTNTAAAARSTLWWGELEPWMDEEYAKQVCGLMGWDPVSIKVPRPAPDPITGQQANNPGYCFLTFPSQAHAASVVSQINNNGGGPSVIMPNSTKPFSLNWASSVPAAPLTAAPTMPGQTIALPNGQNPQYPKEYSIFVGDLAPEVSNSDLVAVFRNPVLGLRNDREPRFIRPFLSCKSAKIMLDPVTGVSRGYGFVRFTDEADQQRALIEMHGLYCLSRPMRISPATAKFKPASGMTGLDFSQMPFPVVPPPAPVVPEQQNQVTIALPLPNANQAKSVSAPLAGANGNTVSNSSSNSSVSAPSLSSGASTTSSTTLASASSEEALKAAQYGGGSASTPGSAGGSIPVPFAQPASEQTMAQKYNISEESWKHHAQARAILSNLIGPNGEQLTSSDPYNTTVFVGGLSPLISEETLRTFFAPFGDIHYVKVPLGKHCGFVQFVRKPDAERAIEKMQGFPIGGSRIRLSWGRSQYKAAQAAAQAAQAAAFQAQYQTQATAQNVPSLTPEQAIQLLEKFGLTNMLNPATSTATNGNQEPLAGIISDATGNRIGATNPFTPSMFGLQQGGGSSSGSAFSPFSPDPNYLGEGMKPEDAHNAAQSQAFSNVSKAYSPWYNPTQDEKVPSANGKISPTTLQTIRPPSAAQRFNSLLGEASSALPFPNGRASSRQEIALRPDLSRRGSQQLQEHFGGHEHEQDPIQDLNGTLASLDLNSPAMWKNGDIAHPLPSSP